MSLLVNNPDILIAIAAIIAAVSLVTSLIIKAWPFTRRFTAIINDMAGEPARAGVPARPGIMERLAKVEQSSALAAYHSQPDGGGSAYDHITQKIELVESDLRAVRTDFDNFKTDMIKVTQNMEEES